MAIKFFDYQLKAIEDIHNGCILCGGVGSGKSLTALGYYFKQNGGDIYSKKWKMKDPKDLYIITTAHKRDTFEWQKEMLHFLLSEEMDKNYYNNVVKVDSWNNLPKYLNVKGAFFIFDEQRLVSNGVWTRSFLKISKENEWILLSATPGDTWMDFIPVFLANGFYKNRSEFVQEHVIYSRFSKFPKVERYINTGRLVRLRNKILVDMDYLTPATPHHLDIWCDYDAFAYKQMIKSRWNSYKNAPIDNAAELCFALRKVVNTSEDRAKEAYRLAKEHKKVIIFYNFDYELTILQSFAYDESFEIAEWNGHMHQPVPDSDQWIYLVQYTAGCEGWNCITTDTIIFFSQNYSYKVMAQACGRIDRLNTPFKDLYYYHLKSKSSIDLAINRAYNAKKDFNKRRFCDKLCK